MDQKRNSAAGLARCTRILLPSAPRICGADKVVHVVCGYFIRRCCPSGFVLMRKDLSRVDPIEQRHHEKHQQCVKNVQVHLMAQQVSVEALQILHDSKYGSNHHEQAGREKDEHVFFPLDSAERAGGRAPTESGVEVDVDHDEEAEKEQLDEEACDGDVGAFVERGDVAACCLDSSAWPPKVSYSSIERVRASILRCTHLHSAP